MCLGWHLPLSSFAFPSLSLEELQGKLKYKQNKKTIQIQWILLKCNPCWKPFAQDPWNKTQHGTQSKKEKGLHGVGLDNSVTGFLHGFSTGEMDQVVSQFIPFDQCESSEVWGTSQQIFPDPQKKYFSPQVLLLLQCLVQELEKALKVTERRQ